MFVAESPDGQGGTVKFSSVVAFSTVGEAIAIEKPAASWPGRRRKGPRTPAASRSWRCSPLRSRDAGRQGHPVG